MLRSGLATGFVSLAALAIFIAAGVRAPTPAMALTAAATASSGTSYRLKITEELKVGSQSWTLGAEGAFDPASATGYLKNTARPEDESRVINGTLYQGGVAANGVWLKYPGNRAYLSTMLVLLAKGGLQSSDPVAFVKSLQDSGATVTQNPDGSFHYVHGGMSGDITLDGDGRIAKITLHSAGSSNDGPATSDVTYELSGYGEPVHVDVPSKVEDFGPGLPTASGAPQMPVRE